MWWCLTWFLFKVTNNIGLPSSASGLWFSHRILDHWCFSVEISGSNEDFAKNCRFWQKPQILVKNCGFWIKNFRFWQKLWILIKIHRFRIKLMWNHIQFHFWVRIQGVNIHPKTVDFGHVFMGAYRIWLCAVLSLSPTGTSVREG